MKKLFKFVKAEPWALLTAPMTALLGYLILIELKGNWYLFASFIAGLIYTFIVMKKWFKKEK